MLLPPGEPEHSSLVCPPKFPIRQLSLCQCCWWSRSPAHRMTRTRYSGGPLPWPGSPWHHLRGVLQGRSSDHHVSICEQRPLPLLFVIGCMSLAFVLLAVLHASRVLIATAIAGIVASNLSLLITRYWRISLRLVGIAGAVTIPVLLPVWPALSLALAPGPAGAFAPHAGRHGSGGQRDCSPLLAMWTRSNHEDCQEALQPQALSTRKP